MSKDLSTHIPEFAGGTVTVTGEEVITPGLRNIQTFVATLAEKDILANEESRVSVYRYEADPQRRFVVRVERAGSNEGVLADSPVAVNWMALGK